MSADLTVISVAGATAIRLLGWSWRIEYHDAHFVDRARAASKTIVYAFWHGRLLPLSFTHRHRAIQVLASEHRDGEMLGRTIRRLGFGHVRGSSTRGGARAIRELVQLLRDGYDLGITVDGPKGPRYEVKPGPLQMAKLSGAAILPITASSRRHKAFTSWDGFQLPLPFTRVSIRYGEPVRVPPDADASLLEAKRIELERILRAITAENDDTVAAR